MCPLLSVRFYSFYFFIRFSMNIFFTEVLLSSVVGSSGLEPPTSRLSGARSNHLSYEPIKLFRCISSLSPLLFAFHLYDVWLSALPTGGDDGIRTHDPLLAGQVLSQLSYTPVFGKWSSRSLKIEQLRSKHSAYTVLRLLITFNLLTIRYTRENVSVSP